MYFCTVFLFVRSSFSDHILFDAQFVSFLYVIFICRTSSSNCNDTLILKCSHMHSKSKIFKRTHSKPNTVSLPILCRSDVQKINLNAQNYAKCVTCHVTYKLFKFKVISFCAGWTSWLALSVCYINMLICIYSYFICSFSCA